MTKRKNFSEKVKNILIILLVIGAVFLGWESQLFGNSSVKLSVFSGLVDDKTAGSGNSGAQEAAKKTIGEARPIGIVITGSTGVHYGAKYDLDEIGRIYDSAVHLFGEALASEQTPAEVNDKLWRTALTSPGFYFEYNSPIQLSVLGGWYRAQVTDSWGERSVRRLCVAAMDGKNRLFFQEDKTGKFFTADTAITTDSITKLSDTHITNKAFFAFEIIGTQPLDDPYALLIPDISTHPLIDVKNPLADEATQIDVRQNLGVSEHLKPIPDGDGGLDYIDNDFTVKVSPDGKVGYTWNGSQESPPEHLEEGEAIEMARRAVSDSIGSYCGEAKIYFDAIHSSDDGAYQVMFKYVIAGGQIYVGEDGYAAVITIENGIITEMELRFRSYAVSDENKKLLPEIQAAAAAGGTFMLSYSDNGNNSLEPSWVAVPKFQVKT